MVDRYFGCFIVISVTFVKQWPRSSRDFPSLVNAALLFFKSKVEESQFHRVSLETPLRYN